jgi:hypothetical protein
MGGRLSAEERAALEGRREQLQLEVRLVEAQLRADEALSCRMGSASVRASGRGWEGDGASGCGEAVSPFWHDSVIATASD